MPVLNPAKWAKKKKEQQQQQSTQTPSGSPHNSQSEYKGNSDPEQRRLGSLPLTGEDSGLRLSSLSPHNRDQSSTPSPTPSLSSGSNPSFGPPFTQRRPLAWQKPPAAPQPRISSEDLTSMLIPRKRARDETQAMIQCISSRLRLSTNGERLLEAFAGVSTCLCCSARPKCSQNNTAAI